MPEYKAYPKSKDTPGRRSRKGSRNSIFIANKVANRKLLKARKEARDERRAAAEAAAEEAEG